MQLRTKVYAPQDGRLVPARVQSPPAAPRARRRGTVRRALLWLTVGVAALAALLYFYVYGDVPGPDDLRAGAQPADHPAPIATAPPAAPAQPPAEAAPPAAPASSATQAAPPPSPAPESAPPPVSPPAAVNRFTGVWKVKVPAVDSSASDAEQLAAGFASAFVPDGTTLDLRADGTFTGTLLIPMEGTWSSEGNTCTLSPTHWNGMTAAEYDRAWEGGASGPRRNTGPIRLQVSSDGARLNLLYDDGTVEDHYSYVRATGG